MTKMTRNGTAYRIYGQPGAPVVVLVHGLGLNKDVWRWMVPALGTSYRVITYDMFGHGDSVAPPETPSLGLFQGQICQLLDHFGVGRAAVVGFSLGGMIARRFVQDNPDRITALGLLHTPYQRTAAAQKAILERVIQARTEGPAATVEAALERWFTDGYRTKNPEMMALVRTRVMANDMAIYHTIYQVLADGVDEITAPNPAITCPTLVVTGDQDFGNGPEMARAIAAEIAGAKVHILQGLRHMALAESPDRVNRPLVAFLNQTLLGPQFTQLS